MEAPAAVDSPSSAQPHLAADILLHFIAIHHFLTSASDEGSETRASALRSRLDGLIADLEARGPHSHESSDTIRTCQVIGRDLSLKLGRAEFTLQGRFRQPWPAADLEALRCRLHDIAGRFPQLGESFRITPTLNRVKKNTPDPASQDGEHDTRGILANSAEESEPKGPRKSKIKGGPDIVSNIRDPEITQSSQTAPIATLYDFILEGLAYKTMHDREEEVVEAHESTFDWVFEKRHRDRLGKQGQQEGETNDMAARLMSWLEGADPRPEPIYWITGKPGSGKSTLMRHLFQHDSTRESLHRWSGGKAVSMAGFFFWTSGSRDQRSQTGMLRSLLHQLLGENMGMIPDTFPELWQRLRTMTTKERIRVSLDWSVGDLLSAMQKFLDMAWPVTNICLFVDGLDEFDGDHEGLINFFRDIGMKSDGKAIKVCLSSRPWRVFEEAFEQAVPHMKLQDLTYQDMLCYASDRLRGNMDLNALFLNDAVATESILDEVMRRADGVFLWIRLAVTELLTSWDAGTGASGMLMLIRQLPSDLELLFSRLLFHSQTQLELATTSVIFQLIRARESVAEFVGDDSANSLTVWELVFALNEQDDALVTSWRVEEASEEFVLARCHDAVSRITQRFARLLDIHAPSSQGNVRLSRYSSDELLDAGEKTVVAAQRLTYIHRTVRDWLMGSPGVQDHLLSKSPESFDSHRRLVRSYVLRLKRPLEKIEHHRRLDEWWPDIVLALSHARHIRDDPPMPQRVLLNELHRTLAWYWLKRRRDPYDDWARNAFGTFETRMKAAPIWQPFLCLAVKFGLTSYVSEELLSRNQSREEGVISANEKLRDDDATPLLTYATEFLCSRKKTIFPLSDPQLVQFLLKNTSPSNPGANHQYPDFVTRTPITPWLAVLRHLRDAQRRDFIQPYDTDAHGTKRWARIVAMFLEDGGANPHAVIDADRWDPETTALGVMESLDEAYGAVEINVLKETIHRKVRGMDKELPVRQSS